MPRVRRTVRYALHHKESPLHNGVSQLRKAKVKRKGRGKIQTASFDPEVRERAQANLMKRWRPPAPKPAKPKSIEPKPRRQIPPP